MEKQNFIIVIDSRNGNWIDNVDKMLEYIKCTLRYATECYKVRGYCFVHELYRWFDCKFNALACTSIYGWSEDVENSGFNDTIMVRTYIGSDGKMNYVLTFEAYRIIK